MARNFINTLLLLVITAFPLKPALALTPVTEKLYYEAGYGGILFGKVGIEISQQPDKAEVTCDITSSGILAVFLKHSSHTTLSASGSNYTYPNRNYESHYHTRKKSRSVKLVYKNGKIDSQDVQPPENREKRPAVPEADINAAYDLMAFLLEMRKEVTEALKSGKTAFTINAYDGRRLSQADFTISGVNTIQIAGQDTKVLTVIARRKPLAGFTQGEIEDFNPDEPSLTVYLSNDDRLTPLRMEVPFLMQKITANLIKECTGQESCLLGNAD